MIRFVLAGIWAATLAVAFSVGRMQSVVEEPMAVQPRAVSATREPSLPEVVPTSEVVRIGNAPKKMAPVAVVQVASVAPEGGVAERQLTFAARMDLAFGEMHPVRRAIRFNELLEGLSANGALALYERLRAEPDSEARHREMELLAFSWGEIDGAAAVAALASSGGRGWGRGDHRGGSLIGSALSGWAMADPDAATAWVKTQDERRRDYYMAGVIKGTALVDPDLAAEQIYTLPFGEARGRAAYGLIEVYSHIGIADG